MHVSYGGSKIDCARHLSSPWNSEGPGPALRENWADLEVELVHVADFWEISERSEGGNRCCRDVRRTCYVDPKAL